MSLIERTIAIIFEGDDRSTAAFKSVSSQLGALETSVEKTARLLAGGAEAVLKLDAALAALAVGGLVYAYNKSVEFESAMAELQKVVGADQVAALEKAKQAALDLSDTYGVASSQIVLAIADFKQAGFGLEDSMLLASNALKLVSVGGVEAAEASDILKRVLKGLGEEAAFSSEVVATLNWVANNFSTDVGMLAEALARSAPLAGTFGMSMQEMAGILVPIIEVFQNSEMAATAFKTALARLKDDTANVEEAFKTLGFTQEFITNRQFMSTKDILFAVAERFVDLDDNMKSVVASALFGKEHFAKMTTVLENMGTVTRVASADTAEMTRVLGEELAIQLAKSETQIDRFKTSFQNLAIVVGDQFKIAATEAIAGATEIENALRQMVSDGTFDPVFDLINEFATELGDFLRQVAQNLPDAFAQIDFSSFVSALRTLRDAFTGYLGDIDLGTPEGLAEALQRVIDVAASLVLVTKGMVDAFKPFATEIGKFFIALAQGDDEAKETIGNLLALGLAVETFGLKMAAAIAILSQVEKDWGFILDAMGATIKVFWNTLEIGVNGIKWLLTDLAISANELFDRMTLGLLDVFQNNIAALEQIKENLDVAIDQDVGHAIDGWNNLAQAFGFAAGEAGGVRQEAEILSFAINDIPEEVSIDFKAFGLEDAKELIESYGVSVADIPEELILNLVAAEDSESFAKAWDAIKAAVPAERDVAVGAQGDQQQIQGVSNSLDVAARPRTATIDVETDTFKLEQMKRQFDLMQTAVEWKAKLDIAEVQANAQIVEALAGTLSAAFSSSAEIISSSVSALAQYDETFDLTGNRNFLKNVIQDELDLRERSMAATEALIEKQIEFMNAKLRAMSSGDALVQIDGAGLQPHLEAFMWEVLSAIQTRVNEEGHAMLFGT